MIIRTKRKTWAEKNIDIYFAFIPMLCTSGDWVWLERYYVYDNCQTLSRSPKKFYKDKEDFYKKVVEGRCRND